MMKASNIRPTLDESTRCCLEAFRGRCNLCVMVVLIIENQSSVVRHQITLDEDTSQESGNVRLWNTILCDHGGCINY